MHTLIVIPARMGSTRFPGKPLVDLCGKPMVQWVYEAAMRSGVAKRVVVATPDDEIAESCRTFGAEAVMTRDDHPSGTDRLAEVAQTIQADVYVNVQGDEPLLPSESIAACAIPLIEKPEVAMGSLWSDCPEDETDNPAVVKVVVGQDGYALYFSRFAVPYPRNPRVDSVRKHIGVYAYRRETLLKSMEWRPTPLERTESLEQLRFLENGVRIWMAEGAGSSMAVDTPEQAEEVRLKLSQGSLP